MAKCFYCGKEFEERELRPYAPGGAMTCYKCGMEHRETTDAMCEAQLMFLKENGGFAHTVNRGFIGLNEIKPTDTIWEIRTFEKVNKLPDAEN